jgi:hypothetical protein
MEIDVYTLRWLAESRLAEARAHSARHALLRSLRAKRGSVLATAGLALIKMGRWLHRRPARARRRPRLAALDTR